MESAYLSTADVQHTEDLDGADVIGDMMVFAASNASDNIDRLVM